MRERRHVYRFGAHAFDTRTGELSGPEETVRLRPQANMVLTLLLERAGHLVSRESLQEAVWSDTVVEFDQGLNSCIREIRRALGDSATEPRFLETFPRRGYRFLAEIRSEPEPEGTSADSPRTRMPRRSLVAIVAALLLIGAGLVWTLTEGASRTSDPGGGRFRLMVLPIDAPGGDAAADTIARILGTRLIGDLSGLAPARLGVIARTSSERFRGAPVSLDELASRFDLDYVVEGSIVPGEEMAVFVRLLDTRDQTQRWSSRYALPDGGVAVIADRVSGAIADAVSPELASAHRRSVASRSGGEGVRDALARVDYLLGLHTMEDTRRAQALVDDALDDHPGSAAMLEARATILTRFGDSVGARAAAEAAIDEQPASAEAHRVLGSLAERERDWEGAEHHYRRAVELAPTASEPRQHLAFLHAYFGRDEEAVREIRAALDLDPVSSTLVADAGVVFQWSGEYAEAERHCEAALALRPAMAAALRCLVRTGILAGRPTVAAAAARQLLETTDRPPDGAPADEILARYWASTRESAGGDGCGPIERARADVATDRLDAAEDAVVSVSRESWRCLLAVAGDETFATLRERAPVRSRLEALGLTDRTSNDR